MKQFEQYYKEKLEPQEGYPPYECLTAETMRVIHNSYGFAFWKLHKSIEFFKAALKRFAEAFPKN